MESRAVQACFVAGTLVHTDRGLVAIEQIRVGDMVLSQPEQTGELTYKRVVQTSSCEAKQVCLVEYVRLADLTDDDENKWQFLVATIDHPFFVKDNGWTRADNLDPGSKYDLMLRDGTFGRSVYQELRNTEEENVVLGMNTHYFDNVGTVVDLRGDAPEITDRDTENDYASELEGGFCEQRVYNIEVEDYHTYYVGEMGVWVRDTKCA